MTAISVYLLGAPYIARGDETVHVDTRKAIALLAYLALTGTRHSRDSLAALFWPESSDTSARAALRRTLSTLNSAIDGIGLHADREFLHMERSPDLWLDVEAFRDQLAQAEAAPTLGERLAALIDAVALYRDDFMAGFALRDSPDFDHWQYAESEALRRELASALEQLVEGYTRQADFTAALEYARDWLALDPLREAAHRSVMRLQTWSGERTAALRQYRECVRILDQELGVPPLEETTLLYEAIQEDRLSPPETPAPDAPSRRSRTRYQASPRTDATAPLLVGRTAEWEALLAAQEKARPDGHVVAIQGEAGIGKTLLAETFFRHVIDTGTVGLAARAYEGESALAYGPFIEALRDAISRATKSRWLDDVPDHWLGELARLLPELRDRYPGLPPATPLNQPGAQSRLFESIAWALDAYFGAQSSGALLLEDIHWADSTSLDFLTFLLRRLEGRPWIVILTWRGEEMAGDHPLHQVLGMLNRDDSATLILLSRLSAGHVAEMVESAQLPESTSRDEIADRLFEETEGLPFFVAEYLTLLASGDSGPAEAWPLPTSVRDLLMARVGDVSEASWQVLTTAAVIGRSFDFDTLRTASGRSDEEVVESLEELMSRGLIREIHDRGGSAQLSFDFSHEKLRALVEGETSLARRRLLHRRIGDALTNQRDAATLAGQAAAHYEQAGMLEEAAEAYYRASENARSVVAFREAAKHLEAAVALGHPASDDLRETIGDLRTLLGDYSAALQSYQSTAALASADVLGRIEHKIGQVYHRLGEWELANQHYEAALKLVNGAEPGLRARVLADRSLTAHARGDFKRATALAHEALTSAETFDDAQALAQSHNILGILARSRADYDDAQAHFERSLAIAEALTDHSARAAALNNLALVFAAMTDYDEAIRLAREALDLLQQMGDRHREAALLNNLADFCHATGWEAESRDYLERAVIIFAEIGEDDQPRPEVWKLIEW